MSTVVICEKPDQSRAHAKLFGIAEQKNGYVVAKNGWIFTHSIGHMVELLEPGKLDPKWERWSLESLPIIPSEWKMTACKDKGAQLKTVLGLLKTADEIVIATDCGREGELIGRELVGLSGNRKAKIRRFWVSSLDEVSLKKGWNEVRDGKDFDGLHQASLIRQRCDFMWGMSLSRAATLTLAPPKTVFPVGRVQTPTLGLVVKRHFDIKNFVPRTYFEIVAQVITASGTVQMTYAPKSEEHRLWEVAKAQALLARVQGAQGPVSVKHTTKRESPPKFPRLSDLQKAASRRWKWPLDKTLDVCQKLYEAGYVSYPRTSSDKVPTEQVSTVAPILAGLVECGWTPGLAPTGASEPLIRKDRFVPEAEIQKEADHHAIIPMESIPSNLGDPDERRLYEMIVHWFVAAISPDYVYNQCDVGLDANGVPLRTSGRTPVEMGFKALTAQGGEEEEGAEKEGAAKLPPLKDGEAGRVDQARMDQKATKPPVLYTDGTLLEDMISIHKFVTDPNLKGRLKETSGLGTEATRANIIKELKGRKLITAVGKGQLDCSPEAITLITALPDALKDPGLTAVWEDYMDEVRHGRADFNQVMRAIEGVITRHTQTLAAAGVSEARKASGDGQARALEHNGHKAACPLCQSPMSFGPGKFGPYWRCTADGCKGSLKADANGKPAAPKVVQEGETCPKCNKHKLVLRKGSKGDFWSCGGYPKCRHTANVEK
ncbi:DNA topoisomerase [Geopseudomonas aromaticivorans]